MFCIRHREKKGASRKTAEHIFRTRRVNYERIVARVRERKANKKKRNGWLITQMVMVYLASRSNKEERGINKYARYLFDLAI